jgi:hypothetical protein
MQVAILILKSVSKLHPGTMMQGQAHNAKGINQAQLPFGRILYVR